MDENTQNQKVRECLLHVLTCLNRRREIYTYINELNRQSDEAHSQLRAAEERLMNVLMLTNSKKQSTKLVAAFGKHFLINLVSGSRVGEMVTEIPLEDLSDA